MLKGLDIKGKIKQAGFKRNADFAFEIGTTPPQLTKALNYGSNSLKLVVAIRDGLRPAFPQITVDDLLENTNQGN
jgi:hypothetical protein